MIYYFAYGSNMDSAQMRERCPDAVALGAACLENYRLAFTIFAPHRNCGAADIVHSQGDSVYGVLYSLTQSDATRLDAFEGAPDHYERLKVIVTYEDSTIEAIAYSVVNKSEGLLPSSHYLGLIREAAERYKFPEAYRKMLQHIDTGR